MTRKEKRILVVPNEDGFGPSALASHLVRELLGRPAPALHVTVWNRSRIDYNRGLYRSEVESGRVSLVPVWNLIQLDKSDGGRVSLEGTLARVGDYGEGSRAYPGRRCRTDFDLVVDFGVPAAARWAAGRGIPSITVFDHAWSRTLRMLGARRPGKGRSVNAPREAWARLVREVSDDERQAGPVFLYPPFLTPEVFRRHWRRALGRRVLEIGAVFGGRVAWRPEEARRFLGLREPGPAILIQGGDTPAWDLVLRRLVPALAAADRKGELAAYGVNLVLYVPARLHGDPALSVLDRPGLRRVRRLRPVPGGTIQEILSVFDLLVTRAGGGSVNDAVACRVPLVCLPEPGMPQVAAILEAASGCGLTRQVDAAGFEADPLGAILAERGRVAANLAMVARMREVPRGGERVVARAILDRLALAGAP